MEIERKFIVHNLPDNLDSYPHSEIEQGYLCMEPVIRIRRMNKQYFLTFKSKGLMARTEHEFPLDKAAYEHLLPKVDGILISKTRYKIPDEHGFIIELDVFHGEYEGLVMAEVEFPSEEVAVEKLEDFEQDNLRLIRMDAENIEEVFDKDEVDRIYLNFSDPWPKDRHAKRRLTSTRFLERYDNILTPEGRVMFKTDNKDLFDFSLEQVEEAGWILENHTYDLHHSEYNEGNVMTEYEEKFSAKGNPICRLVAYRHAK